MIGYFKDFRKCVLVYERDKIQGVVCERDTTVCERDTYFPVQKFYWIDSSFDQLILVMTSYDQLWPDMTSYDQLWPVMTSYDQLWPVMTSYD